MSRLLESELFTRLPPDNMQRFFFELEPLRLRFRSSSLFLRISSFLPDFIRSCCLSLKSSFFLTVSTVLPGTALGTSSMAFNSSPNLSSEAGPLSLGLFPVG